MGILNFFHKVKMYFIRCGEASIPYTTSAENYGAQGEYEFGLLLTSYLPDCRIKRNIIIETADGNAEIDCFVLYNNKLFAIEVKSWKGCLTETTDGFVQRKVDRWTDEIHTKHHKSPFEQLNRAIYLLKKQISAKAWINPVVYFENAASVSVGDDKVYFSDIENLVSYIKNGGKETFGHNAALFFNSCTVTDRLYSKSMQKSDCIISEISFCFNTKCGTLTKSDIRNVRIKHHRCCDTLKIETVDGEIYTTDIENGHIDVTVNSRYYSYAFCKLNYIEIGNNN